MSYASHGHATARRDGTNAFIRHAWPLRTGGRLAWLFVAILSACVHWQPSAAELERNNWAVLVMTSRYWYNYRHVSNVLSFYATIKRLGIPDSRIIVMMAEDVACNPRNSLPGTIFNDMHHNQDLYGDDVEIDYRGDEVSVENFIRLLTGRHPPDTPRNKRLLTDSMSNILFFITGHSGEEFIKFQDTEEITSTDIADAFAQMHTQKRYRKIFWISDTCQAATLQNQFYSPNIMGFGSSGKKENSYSHHADPDLGIAIIDRFTFYALKFLNQLTTTSTESILDFTKTFDPRQLHSTPEIRTDLFEDKPEDVLMTEFLASTGKMRFHKEALQLVQRLKNTTSAFGEGSCTISPRPSSAQVASPPAKMARSDIGPASYSEQLSHAWDHAVRLANSKSRNRRSGTAVASKPIRIEGDSKLDLAAGGAGLFAFCVLALLAYFAL